MVYVLLSEAAHSSIRLSGMRVLLCILLHLTYAAFASQASRSERPQLSVHPEQLEEPAFTFLRRRKKHIWTDDLIDAVNMRGLAADVTDGVPLADLSRLHPSSNWRLAPDLLGARWDPKPWAFS